MCHHEDIFHDLFFVLSDELQAEEKLHFEVIEKVRLESFHQLNIVFS